MPDPTSVKRLSDWDLHPNQFKDMTLDEGNGYNVHLLCTAWVALLKDSPIDGQKTSKAVNRLFVKRLKSDYLGTVRSFCELGDKLVLSLISSERGSYRRPLFREFARTPVFREYLYYWKYGDHEALKYLLSFLWFAKKADYESESFKAAALQGWKRREDELSKIDWSERRTDVLSKIVSRLISKPPEDAHFKHGPGAVAEIGVFGSEKHVELRYHPQFEPILHLFGQSYYATYAFPAALRGHVSSGTRLSEDIARTLMVRKNYKTARSVGMEPTSFMYMQQGVMSLLFDVMRSSRIKRYVDLQDQGKNQAMCIEGSIDQRLSTLDSASASDSVSWELIARIFHEEWVILLNASRTDTVSLPDGSQRRVFKFAPMGSATCFPVQCIIFTAIGILAYSLWYHSLTFEEFCNGVTFKPVMPPRTHLRVFGDDVIADDSYVDIYICLLTYYGFVVNTNKSFRGDLAIRESCGVYACNGDDVTPFIFKTKDLVTFHRDAHAHDDDGNPVPLTPKYVATAYSLIAHANEAKRNGYDNVRNCLIQWIQPQCFVIIEASSPYSRAPWCVHGPEQPSSGRRRVFDRYQRWSIPILRLEDEQDVTTAFQADDDGVIRLSSMCRTHLSDEDARYWYGRSLSNMLRKQQSKRSIRVAYEPLKDLDRRSNLGWSLAPFE